MKYLHFTLLAAAIFCFALWIGNWSENNTLRDRLEHAEETLSHMRAEHELALSAASEAMKAREEIHAYQRQRMCEAEAALGNNPDFCNQPVPDDVRLLWKACEQDTNSPVSPANGATGRH